MWLAPPPDEVASRELEPAPDLYQTEDYRPLAGEWTECDQ